MINQDTKLHWLYQNLQGRTTAAQFVFTDLGAYFVLSWKDTVFLVFSLSVIELPCTLICVMKCAGPHVRFCPINPGFERDRSVGPRGLRLSAWQTAQQPLWQNCYMNWGSQWNSETDEVLGALERRRETRRAWHQCCESQMRQSKKENKGAHFLFFLSVSAQNRILSFHYGGSNEWMNEWIQVKV